MKSPTFGRRVTHLALVLALLMGSLPAAAGDKDFEFGQQVSIRSHTTPCGIYLLRAGDNDRAFRITQNRSPEELSAVIDAFQNDSEKLLSQLKITDLTGVTIASVGAPLKGRVIQQEKDMMRAVLDERGLQHIPVSVFPVPANAIQKVMSYVPLQRDIVPTKNDPQAKRRGLQITGAANLTTVVMLTYVAYLGTNSIPTAVAIAVSTTLGNMIIDYQVGKHRSTIDNFIARAGDSRISALIRDAEIGLVFVVPFFFIPRILEAAIDRSVLPQSWSQAAWFTVQGTLQITTSAFLQALQIFSFMNPNARVNQILLNEGSGTSEAELDQRKVYRIAGFFAITAPIFGTSSSPYAQGFLPEFVISPVALFLPQYAESLSQMQVNWAYVVMAAISGANYVGLYNNPLRMTEGVFSIYEQFGKFLCDYPVEYGFVRPMGLLGQASGTLKNWLVSWWTNRRLSE